MRLRRQDSGLLELRAFAHEQNAFLERTIQAAPREGSNSLGDLSAALWEHDQGIEPTQKEDNLAWSSNGSPIVIVWPLYF